MLVYRERWEEMNDVVSAKHPLLAVVHPVWCCVEPGRLADTWITRYRVGLATGDGPAGGLLGVGGLGARLSRPYDLIIGLLFTAIGLLGLLHNLGYNLVPTTSETATTIGQSAILGLSLALPYALIHTLLGLTSLNHGLRARAHSPTVMVEASSHAA